MTATEHFGTGFVSGEAFAPPAADNENLQLKPDWMTPAELLQLIRQETDRLRRKVAADPRLLTCPERRRQWNERLALERCALWRIVGVREA